MAHEIIVPTLGESIGKIKIVNWLKKDGEVVQRDEIICELESDKTTFEVHAEHAGILHIAAEENSEIAVGEVIARIAEKCALKA